MEQKVKDIEVQVSDVIKSLESMRDFYERNNKTDGKEAAIKEYNDLLEVVDLFRHDMVEANVWAYYKEVDIGIGGYEFWGSKGYDSQIGLELDHIVCEITWMSESMKEHEKEIAIAIDKHVFWDYELYDL